MKRMLIFMTFPCHFTIAKRQLICDDVSSAVEQEAERVPVLREPRALRPLRRDLLAVQLPPGPQHSRLDARQPQGERRHPRRGAQRHAGIDSQFLWVTGFPVL